MAKDSKKKNIEKENDVVEIKTNSKENTEAIKKEEVKSATKTTKKSSKETTKKAKKKNGFFKDFKAELKKVVWPTPKEVANSTTAVIVIVLITTLLVFILDFGFEKLIVHGTEKITSIVSSNAEDDEANNNNITENVVLDVSENTVLETTTNTVEE